MKSDTYWMQKALSLAEDAQGAGEIPVGAVLVDEHGQELGSGYNQVIKHNDPTAHAEILAIREASQSVGNYRLNGTTLYVTLEPCSMCAGAIVHARIKRLVFAARDIRAGAAGSLHNLVGSGNLNHVTHIDEGHCEEKASELLKQFFLARRSFGVNKNVLDFS